MKRWLVGMLFAAAFTNPSQIKFTQNGTGASSRSLASKLGDSVSVTDFFANGVSGARVDPTGVIDSTAGIQAAVNAGGETNFPDGTYLTTSAITLKDNSKINFSLGATMKAGADNMTFFQSLTHAYYAEVWDGVLDGNGHSGVTGFDLTNFRDGSGLFGVRFNAMATGIYLRSLDWSAVIWNNYFSAVNNPIRVSGGSSTVQIWYPQIDGEFFPTCTTGIQIDNTGLTTIGVLIHGGYVQGCSTGILDQAVGTKIDHTYFEVNSVADISESGAADPYISNTQHWGSGVVAIKGRNTTGARIDAPVMGSGNRSTGLYDWDGTNSNSYEMHIVDSGTKNTPLGTATGLNSLGALSTSFTPTTKGSSTTGAGTYTTQSGSYVQNGNTVTFNMEITWTAHTGTGNLVIAGLPATLVPASFVPRRIFHVVLVGAAWTGPVLYAYLNGSGTDMTFVQVAATGVGSLLALPASGTLYVSGSYVQ